MEDNNNQGDSAIDEEQEEDETKINLLFYNLISDFLCSLFLMVLSFSPFYFSTEISKEDGSLLKIFFTFGIIFLFKTFITFYFFKKRNFKSTFLMSLIDKIYSKSLIIAFNIFVVYAAWKFKQNGFKNVKKNPLSILTLFLLIVVGLTNLFRKILFFLSIIISIPIYIHYFITAPIDFISRYGMDPEFIDNWPKEKAKKEQITDCVICSSEIREGEDIIILKCHNKHYFHDECIKQWLKKRVSCPICRSVYLL